LRTLLLVIVVLGVSTVAVGCGAAFKANQSPLIWAEMEDSIKRARDMVYPATVRVEARKTEFFAGQRKRTGGFGSGVVFDPQGHILTNYHVAGQAQELSCMLFSKERVKAKLVGGDPWTDLAVIQLDLEEVKQKGVTFDWAAFGDSSDLSEGDMVLAIGSPFGLSRSISRGIISCRERVLGEAMQLGGGLETGLFSTWIQTDAAINPGNSGGPLVNMRGEVIGINTRGGGNDLGFAVPIDVAKDVVQQILANGKVTRSTVGLVFQPLQDLESFFEVSKTEGVVIASVEPDSPAEAAGIKPQDLLLEYNGRKVMGRYPEDLFQLRRMISDTSVGTEVTLRVRRAGKILDVPLKTAELTTVKSDEVNYETWGFVGQDITKRLATREDLKDTVGVYVTGVRGGEPAEKAQMAHGDVVIRCGNQDVTDAEQLKKLYDESVAKKEQMVLLMVRRGAAVLPKLVKVTYAAEAAPAQEPKKDSEPKPPATEEKG